MSFLPFALKAITRLDNRFNLRNCHGRADWQADNFRMDAFGNRKLFIAPLRICLLLMRRNRVMNQGLNTTFVQMLLQGNTILYANNEKMPNVFRKMRNISFATKR